MATANELQQQIRELKNTTSAQLAELEKELSLVESGFQVNDTLKSSLNNTRFQVTGSNSKGLVGIMLMPGSVIEVNDYKNWRKVT